MVELQISPEDAATLREVLDSARSDLRYEINNTDSHDYRATLRSKQALLEKVLAQLGG
jgi:hypothetical protein